MEPVMYQTPGPAALPSPSIWARCNRQSIESMGCGRFISDDFISVNTVLAGGIVLGLADQWWDLRKLNAPELTDQTDESNEEE